MIEIDEEWLNENKDMKVNCDDETKTMPGTTKTVAAL